MGGAADSANGDGGASTFDREVDDVRMRSEPKEGEREIIEPRRRIILPPGLGGGGGIAALASISEALTDEGRRARGGGPIGRERSEVEEEFLPRFKEGALASRRTGVTGGGAEEVSREELPRVLPTKVRRNF